MAGFNALIWNREEYRALFNSGQSKKVMRGIKEIYSEIGSLAVSNNALAAKMVDEA